jgi:nucleotide-binding universal stress UspA family protein
MGRGKLEQSAVGSSRRFRRILVAVDGSDNAERASRVAVDIAERCESELVAFHAVPRVSHAFVPVRSATLFREYYSDEEKAALRWIDKVMTLAKNKGVNARPDVRVAVPSVAEAIVRYATKKNIDMIIIGTRGLGSFKKLLIGSVSSGVVAHAHCPVLVVR